MRATAIPAFSVVMSTRCEERQVATLRSVAAQCKELGAEFVVALPRSPACDALRDEWNIRAVSIPDDASPAEFRRLAMGHATGDIVFVIDWSVLEEDEWCDRIRRYRPGSLNGAGRESARREGAIDWAEFLAVRGVTRVDLGGALESFTATFASDARPRARRTLDKWTEQLSGAERARTAGQ
jgi:hypothetical protein